jgi:uncharacterized protein
MIYRMYGETGKKVSALGFGGMRFEQVDEHGTCVEMMLHAAKGGVNYFDTAPGYFSKRSELVFGKAFEEFRRQQIPYYLATKTFKSTEKEIREELDEQLKRMNVQHIDFYHIWCITSLDNWHERKQNQILKAFQKIKEEGLIHHICISSHLVGDQIKELLMEGVFEGVLFGYSAYNFQHRQAAFDAIRKHNLGCVVMNPLGGGLIPQNPELFSFLKTQPKETITEAAIRFLLAHTDITVTLVGFGNINQVTEVLNAVHGFDPALIDQLDSLKTKVPHSFDGICTGCQYCEPCPEGIPISKFMDAYNQKLLGESVNGVLDRLKWHWNKPIDLIDNCVECGNCEEDCTQHLNIIERLKEIRHMKPAK